MLRLILLVFLTRMASAIFDEELHNLYTTLPREEFVRYFNKQNYTWHMSEEPYNISFHACVSLYPSDKKLPIIRHTQEDIDNAPENFDARTQWSQCASITQIYSQGDCGSCWTFGAATTASDRTCIHKDLQVNLSEQDFECYTTEVCNGGSTADALTYWKDNGLVTQACKPYDIDKLHQNTCTKSCVDGSIDYNSDKHSGSEVYGVDADIGSIKAELSLNGPIATQFQVYTDFRDGYSGGIYEHKYGTLISAHSVRVIGYGVESGVGYWLVANSWGVGWGESGLFRMKQGQTVLGMDISMVTCKP